MRKYQKLKLSLLAMTVGLMANTVFASGFAFMGANGSQLGNAYAGSSAEANDASINYFNPAGLTLFDTRQVTYSTLVRFSQVDFSGTTQWQYLPSNALFNPFNLPGEVDSRQTNVIPAFNEAIPLNKDFALGLSVVMPFDFSSDFSDDSALQYAATDSSLYVVDITPGLAYQINPKWSVGAGFDAERAEFDLDYAQGFPVMPNNMNSEVENSADGWGYSGHAGVLFQYSPDTRFGLSYHGPVNFDLSGNSQLNGPLSQQSSISGVIDNHFDPTLKLPSFAEFSAYHASGEHIEWLGSIDYFDWHALELNDFNVVTSVNNQITTTTLNEPVALKNAFRFAVGANYIFNQHFKLLTGLAYDQGAVENNSAVNFPDNNSLAIATGLHYELNQQFGFDVGYSHIFGLDSAPVNSLVTAYPQQVAVLGDVKRNENIIGAQITWNIGYLGVVNHT